MWSVEVFRVFERGELRQVGLSVEQVHRLCPESADSGWSVASAVEAVEEAAGVVRTWPSGRDRVHWNCPLCDSLHISDFNPHADDNPVLWLCEAGYGPCLIHWERLNPRRRDEVVPSASPLGAVLASAAETMFLAEGVVIGVNTSESSGDTPLHVMAWRQDSAGAAVLIAAGADVNAVGDMGQTPLHVAVGHRDRPFVDALVRAGARADIVSEFGQTARDRATQEGVLDWLDAAEWTAGRPGSAAPPPRSRLPRLPGCGSHSWPRSVD